MKNIFTEEQEKRIVEGGFNSWINGLWQEVCWEIEENILQNSKEKEEARKNKRVIPYELSAPLFPQQKEAFLYLLEKLLREGKVRFDVPYSRFLETKEEYWNAPPEEIIEYLKEGWPESAKEQNDSDLNDYFYHEEKCPAISWLQEDGTWYGS